MHKAALLVAFVGIIAIVAAASSVPPTNPSTDYLWSDRNGRVVTYGGSFHNITKIATGHYCISDVSGTYAAIVGTLQGEGGNPPKPGHIIANSGWGDACNFWGGNAIYTFDIAGNPADRSFSLVIGYPYPAPRSV